MDLTKEKTLGREKESYDEIIIKTPIEKTRWYERSPNNTSVMRIALMMASICGILMILSGIGLAFLTFFQDKWDSLPMITILITSGAGIIVGGDFAKSIQTRAENSEGVSADTTIEYGAR